MPKSPRKTPLIYLLPSANLYFGLPDVAMLTCMGRLRVKYGFIRKNDPSGFCGVSSDGKCRGHAVNAMAEIRTRYRLANQEVKSQL